jgi:hypothetical protein
MASSNIRGRAVAGPGRRLAVLLCVLAAPCLAGCTGQELTNTLGLTRDAPNEFTVTTRAPLAMPTQFNLPPPDPGAARPQEQSERRKAEEALVPATALAGNSGETSPGQQAILQASGPAAPPDIRAEVNAESALDKPRQTFTEQLMFWKKPPPAGTVVDPTREAQRLRENAALGHSVETGDTPIVQPKRKTLLGDIF